MPAQPHLSLLLPAYDYPIGIDRTLTCLLGSRRKADVEVIVFDDGADPCVRRVVDKSSHEGLTVLYEHHLPPFGAVRNWNALLNAANGRYCLLMHHDEFPLEAGFFDDLLDAIDRSKEDGVMLLGCKLVDEQGNVIRNHLPSWIRGWVVQHAPAYLFKRNVVGPCATLVVARSLYPRFDSQLRWLVDVDCYYRLRLSSGPWTLVPSLCVGSIQGRGDSITASLGDALPGILRQELVMIDEKYKGLPPWGKGAGGTFMAYAEGLAWGLLRAGQFLFERLFGARGR